VVPAEDDVTSLSAIGGNAYHAPAAFVTTHWSVVLEHKANRRRHMRHLKSSARFIGGPFTALCGDKGWAEEAQDLTQVFFALLLERRDLRTVRKEKGDCVLICSQR